MRAYPISGLFSDLGTVELERDGLYFAFHARLHQTLGGVPRLYFHGAQSLRIATFSANMEARGRISCRALNAPDCGAFSVLREPWRAMRLPDFSAPVTALKTQGGWLAAFPVGAALPEEAVSRFCFLYRAEVDGFPCRLLNLDDAGNPRFNS